MAYNKVKFDNVLQSIVADELKDIHLNLNGWGLDNDDFAKLIQAFCQSKVYKNKLQTLNLDTNLIDDLQGFEFSQLPSLREIKLSHNKISTFPNLLNCDNLVKVDLSYNTIREGADRISLSRAVSIDLQSNRIQSAPNIEGCSKLEYFNLEKNSLKELKLDKGYARISQLWIIAGNKLSAEALKAIAECRKENQQKQELFFKFNLAAKNLKLAPKNTGNTNPAAEITENVELKIQF